MKKNMIIIICAGILLFSWLIVLKNIKVCRDDYDETISRGDMYYEKGYYYDASRMYKKAMNIDENSDISFKYVSCFKELKEDDRYIDELIKLDEKYSQNKIIIKAILDHYLSFSNYDSMIAVMTKYREKNLTSDLIANYENILRKRYKLKYLNYNKVYYFNNEYIVFEDRNAKGLADINTYNRILYEYDKIEAFSKTKPSVASVKKDEEVFFVDENGYKRIYLSNKYQFLGNYAKNGLASFSRENINGYIDLKGQEYIRDYDKCLDFFDSSSTFVKVKSKWKQIDSELSYLNNDIFENVYVDSMGKSFNYNRAFVMNGGKYAMIDEKGNLITDYVFDKVSLFYSDKDDAAVKIGDEYAFIDREGNISVYEDCQEIQSYNCGLAPIKIDDLWGFIDCEGNIVIEPEFEEVFIFNDRGKTIVKTENQYYVLELVYF